MRGVNLRMGRTIKNRAGKAKICLAGSLVAMACSASVQAGTLYWDGDGTGATGSPPTAGVGGSGTWDASTTPNWFNGATYQFWTNSGGQDIADFRGTAGTVSINSGETENANQLNFNSSGYVITGDSSTTLNLTGSSIITTSIGTASITAPLTGNALTVAGPGNLYVAITPTTSINGPLTISSGSTLSTNGNIGTSTTLNGGTIAFNVPSGTTVSGGSPTLTVTAPSTIQFNQPGSGGAATYFYGTLNLGGNLSLDAQTYAYNYYYGMPTTTFFGGISLQGNETLSISGINTGAPTQINTVNVLAGGLTGAYTLTKAGNGTLNVPTGSNYSGLNVTGGTVNASDPSGIPTATLGLSGGTFGVTAAAGSNIASAATVTVTGTSAINISQPGSNGGANYSFGTLSLGGGTFSVAEVNTGNYYYGQATASFGTTSLAADETLYINGGTVGYGPNGGDRLRVTLGPVTGAHTLTKTGNGTLIIAPGSNYTGLVLNSGLTTVTDAAGLPTAALNLSGGTLSLYAPAGSIANDPNTAVTVTADSSINIDQPQNGGNAKYILGSLTIGNNLTITQPFTAHYYYGQPTLNFGATTLTANTNIVETGGTAGGLLSTSLGPITGAFTISHSGNATFNVSAGVGGNYLGLNISGGATTINDVGGFPTGSLTLGGVTLNLLLPNRTNAAVAATSVTADSVLSINQVGSTAGANYSLGALSIGSNMLTITLPTPGNYYYGLPAVTASSATFTGNANFNVSGAAGGFTLTPTIGAIAGTVFSLTKTGAANLTLTGSNSYTGGTNVSTGILTFSAPSALPTNTALTIGTGATAIAANHGANPKNNLFASTLTLSGATGAWTSLLDLTNNDLDVSSGTLATLNDQVKQGFNGGAWNGTGGIVSAAAAANTSHLTALGTIQNSVTGTPSGAPLYGSGTTLGLFDGANPANTDVLVKYTYYGDTDLNGKVDASDYSRIDNGFTTHATGWFNGDFNYDGVVNGSDYTLMDNAFNTQGAQIASIVATPTAEISGGSTTAAVPEPCTLSLMGMGAVGLLGRRRRVN